PRDSDVSFFRELFARAFCFAKHSLERLRVEMSLIEGDATFLNHARDDARFRYARTDRANTAIAALGDFVDRCAHLCRRQKSVAPTIHRGATGMRSLSAECNGVALDTERTEYSSERKIEIKQYRALLDMQFEIRGGVFQFFAT